MSPYSRATFRPIVDGEVAWQKQLRDRYLDSDPPPAGDLSLKRARVVRVSKDEARQIILKYEWLGTMVPTNLHYGITFGPYLAGVTSMAINGSGTAGSNVSREWGVNKPGLAILARGACVAWAPPGANSKLVAWSTRLLTDHYPPTRIVIAYADADAGEMGTIYQACNWSYVGVTHSPPELVSPDGRMMNMRAVDQRAKQRQVSWTEMRRRFEDSGWRCQPSTRKRKYVWVVRGRDDPELWALVASRRLPYPKRSVDAQDA